MAGMSDASIPARPAAAPRLLRQSLREATTDAHAELEAALDLLGRVSDGQAFGRVMERFLGFHIVWEQVIQRQPALRAFHESRRRLPHLRRDLAALGRTNAEQAALPSCAAAAALADSSAAGIGSIYVLEGSTLGGQVIGRALSGAAWTPPGGLTYFDPYRSRTGEMWRGFGDWAEASVAPEAREAAVEGARRTFCVLQGWLTS
jgi:heme oxygenase